MNDDTPPAHTPPQRTGKAAPGRSTGKGRRGRSAGARRASEITAAEAEGRAPRQHRASCASVVSKAGGRWKTVKNKMGTRKSDGQCVRFTTSANTKITATTAAKHRGLPHAWLRSESTPRVHSAIEERTEGEASAARGKREASAQQAQQLQKENRKTAESGKRKRTLRGVTGRDTCTHTHANTQTHTHAHAPHIIHQPPPHQQKKKKTARKKGIKTAHSLRIMRAQGPLRQRRRAKIQAPEARPRTTAQRTRVTREAVQSVQRAHRCYIALAHKMMKLWGRNSKNTYKEALLTGSQRSVQDVHCDSAHHTNKKKRERKG